MNKKNKSKNIDLSGKKSDYSRETNSHLKSTLFSKGKKSDAFFTEDSKLYITPKEFELIRNGVKLDRKIHKWDSLSSRIVNDFQRYNPSAASKLLGLLEDRYADLQQTASEASQNIVGQFGMVRLWNMSIVGAILFGMVTMTFVYRYLGQGASANDAKNVAAIEQQVSTVEIPSIAPKVLGAETTRTVTKKTAADIENDKKKQLEKEIREVLKGKPMEKMAPYIANYDRKVAAFIVAIGRKESSWGVHVPVLNGQDCYNYWGYRGQRELMGTGGHTCFNSPKDGVDTVAKRIDYLVNEQGRNTPEKMVIWKCGNNCAVTGGQAAANKWISDVDGIFKKFNKDEK
jgi:hypothetical protein